jgi:hypothetical protein
MTAKSLFRSQPVCFCRSFPATAFLPKLIREDCYFVAARLSSGFVALFLEERGTLDSKFLRDGLRPPFLFVYVRWWRLWALLFGWPSLSR